MLDKLVKDIKEAAKLAMESTYAADDTQGSCNMDQVWILVPGNRKQVELAIKEASFIPNTSGRDRSFTVSPPGAWQGEKRTTWCETFAREMEKRGYSSGVLYVRV